MLSKNVSRSHYVVVLVALLAILLPSKSLVAQSLLQGNEWFVSSPQSDVFHLGRNYENILFDDEVGSADNITDDYRIFPFYTDRPTDIRVVLYDRDQKKLGNIVDGRKVDKGSHYFVVTYNDIFEKTKSTGEFTLRLELSKPDGRLKAGNVLAEFKGVLKKYVNGYLLGKIIYSDVLIDNGELSLTYTDLKVKGRGPDISLIRSYSSHARGKDMVSTLGPGWEFNLNIYIRPIAFDNVAKFNIPEWIVNKRSRFNSFDSINYDNRQLKYVYITNGGHFKKVNGKWMPTMGFHGELTEVANKIIYYSKDKSEYHFKKHNVTKIQDPYIWFVNKGNKIPEGVVASYGRIKNSHVEFIKDRKGNTLKFKYMKTPYGPLLIEATDAVNRTLSFKYKKLPDVLLSESMPYRLIRVIGPEKFDITYRYNNENYLSGFTKAYTHEEYVYTMVGGENNGDKVNNLTRVVNANNKAVTYQYFTAIQLPGYFSTKYPGVSMNSVISKIVKPDNSTRHFTYNINDQYKRSIYDGKEIETKYTLTNNGNPQVIKYPLGLKVIKTWGPMDGVNDLVQIKNVNGNISTYYKYDSQGNVVEKREFKKIIERDQDGNITNESEFENDLVSSKWNKYSLLEERSWPGSSSYYANYDQSGNILKQITANGKVNSFIYNKFGEIIKKTTKDGNVTGYEYNKWGLVSKKTESTTDSTSFEYDARGRKISEISAAGDTKYFKYDLLDMVVEETINDKIKKFKYDKTGELVEQTTDTGSILSYLLDPLGRVIETKSSSGWYKKYSYDRNSNTISTQINNGVIRRFEYDLENNEVFAPLSVNHEGNAFQEGR